MVTIIFEPHATSFDNEQGLSSGWNNVLLSPQGEQQAKELGERYKDNRPDVVFCSDLSRSYMTAAIAFGDDAHDANPRLVFTDWRLRECDYGAFTQKPKEEVEPQKAERISEPFANGESYEDCAMRMKSFLNDLLIKFDGKTVMIIGHRATQYGLDRWINGKELKQCVTDPWKWQPGWTYQLKSL